MLLDFRPIEFRAFPYRVHLECDGSWTASLYNPGTVWEPFAMKLASAQEAQWACERNRLEAMAACPDDCAAGF